MKKQSQPCQFPFRVLCLAVDVVYLLHSERWVGVLTGLAGFRVDHLMEDVDRACVSG